MRIAIWHNLPSGGGKRALQNQINGLVKRGHYIKVWTPPSSCQTFADLRPMVEEVVLALPDNSTHRSWRYRGRRTSAIIIDRIEGMRAHCRACADQINAGRFDVLMGQPCMYFRASAIATACNMPSLMYLQEPFRSLYEAQPELPWLAPALEVPRVWPAGKLRLTLREWDANYALRLQARVELEWMRSFDMIGVNSLFSRESIMRAYGLESRLLYLGVDTTAFQPTSSTKKPYAIGLGSISMAKGLDRAVEAIAAIPAEKRPPLIWIGNVGQHEFERKLMQRAKEAGVDLTIKVMVDDTELVRLISEAACMIYVSRLEPFGLAPLEACACCTPVVAIAEGGVRETIVDGKNGKVVPDFDPVALGAAIASFTNDLVLAREFGARARKYVVDNWQWEAMDGPLEAALERCLSRKK